MFVRFCVVTVKFFYDSLLPYTFVKSAGSYDSCLHDQISIQKCKFLEIFAFFKNYKRTKWLPLPVVKVTTTCEGWVDCYVNSLNTVLILILHRTRSCIYFKMLFQLINTLAQMTFASESRRNSIETPHQFLLNGFGIFFIILLVYAGYQVFILLVFRASNCLGCINRDCVIPIQNYFINMGETMDLLSSSNEYTTGSGYSADPFETDRFRADFPGRCDSTNFDGSDDRFFLGSFVHCYKPVFSVNYISVRCKYSNCCL